MNKNQLTDSLNVLLSNLHIHYQKLRHFHWNIKGNQFFTLHQIFETWYNEVKIQIDEVSERILSINQIPYSTLRKYLEIATIEEPPAITFNATTMLTHLSKDFKALNADYKKAIAQATDVNDEGTIDLLSGYLKTTEKKQWMVNAFLNH